MQNDKMDNNKQIEILENISESVEACSAKLIPVYHIVDKRLE